MGLVFVGIIRDCNYNSVEGGLKVLIMKLHLNIEKYSLNIVQKLFKACFVYGVVDNFCR